MSLIKAIAYHSLDAITLWRGVERHIDGRPIKFPARWSRYYASAYDPATFEFLDAHVTTGGTVLDIGAHIGLFSVAMARAVGETGKVFSFEPTPFTRSVLRQVIDNNGCSDIVEIHAEAVSRSRGTAVFYDAGEVSNANSLVRSDKNVSEVEVDLISVDEFVRERSLVIDCIKIDVEGAELDVLLGARETFLTQRPAARLGLHPAFIAQNGQSLKEIWQILADYRLRVIFDGTPADKEWFCSRSDLFDVNLLPS